MESGVRTGTCIVLFFEKSAAVVVTGIRTGDQDKGGSCIDAAACSHDHKIYIHLQCLPSAPSGKTDRDLLKSIATSVSLKELVRYLANDKPVSHTLTSTGHEIPSQKPSQADDKFLALQKPWSHVLGIPSELIQRDDH